MTKPSKRNQERAAAKAAKLAAGPPRQSKYGAKVRGLEAAAEKKAAPAIKNNEGETSR